MNNNQINAAKQDVAFQNLLKSITPADKTLKQVEQTKIFGDHAKKNASFVLRNLLEESNFREVEYTIMVREILRGSREVLRMLTACRDVKGKLDVKKAVATLQQMPDQALEDIATGVDIDVVNSMSLEGILDLISAEDLHTMDSETKGETSALLGSKIKFLNSVQALRMSIVAVATLDELPEGFTEGLREILKEMAELEATAITATTMKDFDDTLTPATAIVVKLQELMPFRKKIETELVISEEALSVYNELRSILENRLGRALPEEFVLKQKSSPIDFTQKLMHAASLVALNQDKFPDSESHYVLNRLKLLASKVMPTSK